MMAEKLSVIMARRHLEAADVALLIIDATEGVTAIDATIGGYAHESGRSVIIVVNKWDLVTTATHRRQAARRPARSTKSRYATCSSTWTMPRWSSSPPRTAQPAPCSRGHQASRRRAPQARLHRPDEPLPGARRLPARHRARRQENPHLLHDPGRRRPAHVRPLHRPRRSSCTSPSSASSKIRFAKPSASLAPQSGSKCAPATRESRTPLVSKHAQGGSRFTGRPLMFAVACVVTEPARR